MGILMCYLKRFLQYPISEIELKTLFLPVVAVIDIVDRDYSSGVSGT
jgi:hypothetical protein